MHGPISGVLKRAQLKSQFQILTVRVLAISAAQGRMHTLAGLEQNANVVVRTYHAGS